MTAWTWTALALMLALLPPAFVIVVRGTFDRLIALQFAGTVTTLALVVLAVAFGESSIVSLALALALLTLPGSLVFIDIYERWL